MTDIRRTVLWVVFSMSLLLLWDGWQRHNGRPSMFAPTPPAAATQPAAAPPASGVPQAAAQLGSPAPA
ncbi:membrane protein insertase YidC, partial [Inhella sp. 1Y17]|nr:membrane protein insertase YidC [Inhella proteolytica]